MIGYRIPQHIALILDGNRRYAAKIGLPKIAGHEYGAKNLGNLFTWCKELGIAQVTLYAFSTENFKRSNEEVSALLGLVRLYYKRYKSKLAKLNKKYDLRIRVIGRTELFPDDIKRIITEIVELTTENRGLIVNIALGYGSRTEIIDAVKKIIAEVKQKKIDEKTIDEKTITQRLYLSDEPDILIRPGGEKRLSNFLLWQLSYAELFFVDKLWPEFTKEDLIEIIKEFNLRERRFGK